MNGTWRFKLFNTVEEALAFVSSSQPCASSTSMPPSSPSSSKKDDDGLENIQVPGHWQLQIVGDSPIYTNVKYIIPVEPPMVPVKFNPTGYYKYKLAIPPSWGNRRTIIHFGAVDNAFYAWCNGKFIGFSKDSRLPAEFDISHVIHQKGQSNQNALNVIECAVIRYSDGFYLEDQDMFNLSGIFRDVYCYSLPQQVHIFDFKWRTAVDYSTQIANVVVDVHLLWDTSILYDLLESDSPHKSSYLAQLRSDWLVVCSLYEEGILKSSYKAPMYHSFAFENQQAEPCCSASDFAPLPLLLPKSRQDCIIPGTGTATSAAFLKQTLAMDSAATWSAERPHVYTLTISLVNTRDGTVIQSESSRVGFRTVDISTGLLRVSQRPLMIRGVNLHEHDPLHGHHVARELLEADIKLLKRNNFNAVRTSHYPHHPWLYELCTLYGLYVVDEANIETHGMKPYIGRLADDPQWEDAFMQRLIRMYERDKTHPCIIGWSLGNESGYGTIHDKMAAWIRHTDPSRFVMYEPASYGPREENPSRDVATDILCPMYARMEDCIKLGNMYSDMPLVQCEYAHMMGNSGGNLAEYWEGFRLHARLQGGFIWDWVDQGISVVDSQERLKWAYGGDFGEVEHDGNFCLNGLNWPDRGLGWVLGSNDNSKGNEPFSPQTARAFPSDCEHDGGENLDRLQPSESGSAGPHPGVIPSACTTTAKWGTVRNVAIIQPVYGCSGGFQGQESQQHGDALSEFSNGALIRDSVNVNAAMSKPALIETKHCMKGFSATVLGLRFAFESGRKFGVVVNTEDGAGAHIERLEAMDCSSSDSSQSPPRAKSRADSNSFSIGEACTPSPPNQKSMAVDTGRRRLVSDRSNSLDLDAQDLNVTETGTIFSVDVTPFQAISPPPTRNPNADTFLSTIRMSVISSYDHLTDVQSELSFRGLLLCNGLVVAHGELRAISSGYQHRHAATETSGRHSIQEIEIEGGFRVSLFPAPSHTMSSMYVGQSLDQAQSSTKRAVYGLPWCEKTTLSAEALDSIPPALLACQGKRQYAATGLHEVPNGYWTEATGATWSVVILGRLACHTPWAKMGYPMGHVQAEITRHFTAVLSRHLEEANVHEPTSADTSSNSTVSPRSPQFLSPDMAHLSDDAPTLACTWAYSSIGQDCTSTLAADVCMTHTSLGRKTSIVISSATGMLDSIIINGQNFLADQKVLGSTLTPSRVHLHRAPTDNDRLGYSPRWDAVGLSSQMRYVPTSGRLSGDKHDGGEEVVGSVVLDSVTITRLPDNYDSSTHSSSQSTSIGVHCHWAMEPERTDNVKIGLLRGVAAFHEDPLAQRCTVRARDESEEAYIHQLAGALCLGRHTLPRPAKTPGRRESIGQGDQDPARVGILVELWKPALFMCSTIKKAEALAGGGPQGLRGGKAIVVDLATDTDLHGPAPRVEWSVTYVLDIEGKVSGQPTISPSAHGSILIIF